MFKLINHALDQVSLFVNWMTDQERPWSDIYSEQQNQNKHTFSSQIIRNQLQIKASDSQCNKQHT